MMEIDTRSFELLFRTERPRLVQLCANFTQSRATAEDLAQETLIEAWRHRAKLVDGTGYAPWLSAIARNVCLRWMRQQGRHSTQVMDSLQLTDESELASASQDPIDLEIELEREELITLLDRAMGLLPAKTRDALVYRYVAELPQAQIAERLQVSEGAVEARLRRGKLTLHRILVTDMYQDASELGVIERADKRWQETRIWCSECGQHRLWGQLPQVTGNFELHCPQCYWERDLFYAESPAAPYLAGVKGFRATLKRLAAFMDGYLRPAKRDGKVSCIRCGHKTALHLQVPPDVPAALRGRRGVHIHCEECGSRSCSDLNGLALNLPQAMDFWRRHPRIRTLPQLEMNVDGQPAVVVRFESVKEAACFYVAFTHDRYELLNVVENHCELGDNHE